jgi:hypothetical protein
MDAHLRPRVASAWRRSLILVVAAFLPEISAPYQPAAALSIAKQPGVDMKTFVIIFRQGPRPLTESDKQRRAGEVTAWARGVNEAGHKLDPRILAPAGAHRGQQPSTTVGAEAWPVTALLFLEAEDLDDATQVAEAHPALRYGAAVEVRPWAPPVPVAAPARPPAVR